MRVVIPSSLNISYLPCSVLNEFVPVIFLDGDLTAVITDKLRIQIRSLSETECLENDERTYLEFVLGKTPTLVFCNTSALITPKESVHRLGIFAFLCLWIEHQFDAMTGWSSVKILTN